MKIVDLPMKNGDLMLVNVKFPEGNRHRFVGELNVVGWLIVRFYSQNERKPQSWHIELPSGSVTNFVEVISLNHAALPRNWVSVQPLQ